MLAALMVVITDSCLAKQHATHKCVQTYKICGSLQIIPLVILM